MSARRVEPVVRRAGARRRASQTSAKIACGAVALDEEEVAHVVGAGAPSAAARRR